MNKFERLIEFVIQDEVEKARELFHDIVVEKSRTIYEDLMDEGEEFDMSDEVDADEGGDEEFSDEESFSDDDGDEEFSDEEVDFDDDDSSEGDLEDRVVDLEDQLDELMAEFEALMSDEDEGLDDMGDEDMDFSDDEIEVDGGDELATDDTESFDELSENIDLTPAPKPVTSEESWVNTKSINADNSGAIGAVAKPVPAGSDKAEGRAAPKVGDLPDAGKFKNVPAKDNSKLTAAPKPVTSQASGTNTTTPFPKV